MEISVFRVVTVHCEDCATLVTDTLRALPGVGSAEVSRTDREVRVALDPDGTDRATVAAALRDLGFRLRTPAPGRPEPAAAGGQVSDDAWAVLAPLLAARPPNRRTRDDRLLFEGIAYKHRADVRWRAVPPEFGPWQTVYARWARWRADGTLSRLAAAARHDTALAAELTWLPSADEPPG